MWNINQDYALKRKKACDEVFWLASVHPLLDKEDMDEIATAVRKVATAFVEKKEKRNCDKLCYRSRQSLTLRIKGEIMAKIKKIKSYPGKSPDECFEKFAQAFESAEFEIFKTREIAWLVMAHKHIEKGLIEASLGARPPASNASITLSISNSECTREELEPLAGQGFHRVGEDLVRNSEKESAKANSPADFIAQSNHILDSEIRALQSCRENLDYQQMQAALSMILECTGRVYITGSGTSSTVARRMAHTFTCSGAPSIYIDSGQSQHGYSALLQPGDVLIAISRGGETDEINFLCKLAKSKGIKIIGILENTKSTLGQISDIILIASVEKDNEPLRTIPLSSTIVQEAVGDVLCCAINLKSGFDLTTFQKYHPGGAVGKLKTK